MNNEFYLLILVFLISLWLRVDIRQKNSILRKLITKHSRNKINRLKEKQEYDKIAKRYRWIAKINRKKHIKENPLGLACIYEHDSKNAIEHFKNALEGATGARIYTIKGNLALAYLQNRWYREATSLLEELRKEGPVPIIPYTMTLLINGQDNEARKFYEDYQLAGHRCRGFKKIIGI